MRARSTTQPDGPIADSVVSRDRGQDIATSLLPSCECAAGISVGHNSKSGRIKFLLFNNIELVTVIHRLRSTEPDGSLMNRLPNPLVPYL